MKVLVKSFKKYITYLFFVLSILVGRVPLATAQTNTPPVIGLGIPNQHFKTGEAIDFKFPSNAFKDAETSNLNYEVSGLPAGLTFSKVQRRFTGTINTPKQYDITITAKDPDQASVSQTFSLYIHSSTQTYAAFTMNTNKGCNFQTVNFYNKSNNATKYDWDFGNGNTSIEKNPSATFPKPGTYTVTLRINGGTTGALVYSEKIHIYPSPEPAIEVFQNQGCTPFDATISSTNNPVQVASFDLNGTNVEGIDGALESRYQWSFYGKLPTQITTTSNLDLEGIKEYIDIVHLKVTDIQGCEGSAIKRDPFTVHPSPEVSYQYEKAGSCAPSQVTFNAEIKDPSPIKEYEWKINGTLLPTEKNAQMKFAFTNYGEYRVSVKAITLNECNSNEYIDTIRFNNNNTANFEATIACVGDSSSFKLTNTTNVKSCFWTFGDGGVSTELNPKHVYNSTGNKEVKANVTFTDNCKTVVAKTIHIEGISIAFTSQKLATCPGVDLQYRFTDTSTLTPAGNTVTQRTWYVKNGAGVYEEKSKNSVFDANFTQPGTYWVKLELESQSGCRAEQEQEISVSEPTILMQATSPLRGCIPLDVTLAASFTDAAYTVNSYNWDFNNDNITDATGTSVSYQYTTAGNFPIKLTVNTSGGCNFTKTLDISATPANKPSIQSVTVDQTAGLCRNNDVVFTVNFSPGTDTLIVDFPNDRRVYSVSGTTDTISYQFSDWGDNIQVSFYAQTNGCTSPEFVNTDVTIVPPIARFRPLQNTFCAAPYEASFVDSVTVTDPSRVTYYWDFGNDITSASKNPGTVKYLTPDNYNVSLTITDLVTGCTDEVSQVLHMYQFNYDENLIWADDTTGCHPKTVQFNQQVSSFISSNLQINSYKWDFDGDGIVDDSTSIGPQFEYTYTKPGLFSPTLTVYAENGCEYPITRSNYIDIKGPVADFEIQTNMVCEGVRVDLVDRTTKAPSDDSDVSIHKWTLDADAQNFYFTNGSNQNSQSPSVIFTRSDSLKVKLLVQNESGCTDTISKRIYIDVEEWQPSFVVADTVCLGQTTTFTNLSVGNLDYSWNFGDTSSSTLQAPTHQYTTIGTYNVTLTVANQNQPGCTRAFNKEITIVEGTADFAVPDSACAPAFFYFRPFVDQTIVKSYNWNFGDGGTSAERIPGHEYLKPGTYNVSLEVKLRSGCTYSESHEIVVLGPNGDFNYSATSACSNVAINFSAQNLSSISGLTWDFGDGNTKTDTIENVTEYSTEYTYNSSGEKSPMLILISAESACPSLALFDPNSKINVSDAPKAKFELSSTQICEGVDIVFTDHSDPVDSFFEIDQWDWNFGDGSTVDVQNPEHSYADAGTYPVELTVTNSAGCKSTLKKDNAVTIYNAGNVTADFTFSPTIACPGTPIQFKNESKSNNGGDIKTWSWDFGDNVSSSSYDASHVYDGSGSNVKTVTLSVTDDKQCSNEISKTLSTSNLTVNFDYSPATIYRGKEVVQFTSHITNAGTGTIDDLDWTFQSGSPKESKDENPDVFFGTIANKQEVSLTVSNTDGCVTTATKTFNILNNPPTVDTIRLSDIVENQSQTFTSSLFINKFNPNDLDQRLVEIRFDQLPTNGNLFFKGDSVDTSDRIPVDQIDQLEYRPNTNWSGPESFAWNGYDGYNWANDAASITFKVRDIVSGIDIGGLVYNPKKDSILGIPGSDLIRSFGTTDAQHNQLTRIMITQLPDASKGTLYLGFVAVVVGKEYSLGEINTPGLRFEPALNYVSIGYDIEIKWNGSDGTSFADSVGEIKIQYTNSAPNLNPIEKVANKDSDVDITWFDFQTAFDDEGDVLKEIDITWLPDESLGVFYMNDQPLSTGEITVDQFSEITFVPAQNFQGTVRANWNASDGAAYSSAGSQIIIEYINTPPTLDSMTFTINEDDTLSFTRADFKNNFNDQDQYDSLQSIIIRSLPSLYGKLYLNNIEIENRDVQILASQLDGLKFIPSLDYSDKASFEVQASDGQDSAHYNTTITIIINAVNDAPVAKDDSFEINEDETLRGVSVATNDSDVDNEKSELLFTGLWDLRDIQDKWGTLSLQYDGPYGGSFSFDPKDDFFGKIELSYQVCDTVDACDTATIYINIKSVNDAPVANDDNFGVFQTIPDTFDVLKNDSDIDGNIVPSTLLIVIPPKKGTATVVDGKISYTSEGTNLGADSLQYSIEDNEGAIGHAWVGITIYTIADSLFAIDDKYETDENVAISFEPAENDRHITEGYLDLSSIQIISNPKYGVVSEVDPTNFQGKFEYTPNLHFHGQDTMRYRISDILLNLREASIVITVHSVPDDPIANNFKVSTDEDMSIDINLAANASDVDGDLNAASAVVIADPKNGKITYFDPKDGRISYKPNENFNGQDSLTYQIFDSTQPLPLVSNLATVYITVNAVNDPPIANPDSYVLAEDHEGLFNVLANDTDPDGNLDPSSLEIIDGPSHGTATVKNGQVRYEPDADYFGNDEFIYRISDTTFLSDTAKVTITITPVNDAPRPAADEASMYEDDTLVKGGAGEDFNGVLENDIEVDGEKMTVTTIFFENESNTTSPVQGKYGTLEWNADGSYLYKRTAYLDTMNVSDSCKDQFIYEVADETSLTDRSTLTITIHGKNTPPVATANFYNLNEDEFVSKRITDPDHLLAKASDVDGDVTKITVFTVNNTNISNTVEGKYGTLTWYTDGTFKYEPNPDAVRPLRPEDVVNDTLHYAIMDEGGAVGESTITFNITGVNNAPDCKNDTLEIVFKKENIINVLENDTDPDFGDTITVKTLKKGEEADSLKGTLKGSYGELFWKADGKVVYEAVDTLVEPLMANELAIDAFTYVITDKDGLTCEAKIEVYMIGENDPIEASNDSVTVEEDGYLHGIKVLENDKDPDNFGEGNFDYSALTITVLPKHGKVSVNTFDGTLSYFPSDNFHGKDSLQYQICDTGDPVYCDRAWLYIDVTSVNDKPEATHLVIRTKTNTPVAFDALGQVTDIDDGIDATTLTITRKPDQGTSVVDVAKSTITYDPSSDFTGSDELIYSLSDYAGERAYVIVSILVIPDETMAFAQNDQAYTLEDTPAIIYILENDTLNGVFADPLSVDIKVYPENGLATYNMIERRIEYTPNADYSGTDRLIYTVCGNNGFCDMAVVNIQVNQVNDPIIANDDARETVLNTAVLIPVLANDKDKDGTPLPSTMKVIVAPSSGKAQIDFTTGNILYTPANGFTGWVTFTYSVCDDTNPSIQTCDNALVTVLVKPLVNNIFVANDYYETNENEAKILEPHPVTNDTANEGFQIDSNSFMIFEGPEFGTITTDGQGKITYTPNENYFGPDMMRYRICTQSPANQCDMGEINLWVNEINTPPVANDDNFVVGENVEKRLLVLANDYDVDGTLDYSKLKLITNAAELKGTVKVDNNTGTILYMPNTNTAIDEFIYEICDNDGLCSRAKVTITVDLGSTLLAKQVLNEDTPDTLDVAPLLQAYNLNFAITQATTISAPANGTLTLIENNTKVIYMPELNFNGYNYYNLSLCAADGTSCADLRVNVTVLPINDAPVANPDTITWSGLANEFSFKYDVLLKNDTDIEKDTLHVVPVVLNHAPEFQLTYNADSTLTLKADTIYWCEAWFEYQIADPSDSTAVGRVTLIPVLKGITAVNDNLQAHENKPESVDVLSNDIYVDNQRCTIDTVLIINGPFEGTAIVTNNLDITYTPAPDYWGADSLQYQLTDRWGQTDRAWVYIWVDQENLPPIAVSDDSHTEFGLPVAISVLDNDYDQDKDGYLDTLRTYISTPPEYGSAVFDRENGVIVYTPEIGNCEGDKFGYTIFDNEGDSASAVVIITMANEAPIYPVADTVSTYPGLAVEVFPMANDSGYFAPLIYDYTMPSHGYVTQTGNDLLTYTPEGGFVGRDSIIYQIQSVCGNKQGAYILFLVEKLRVPEIITPNGDGKNDYLIIDGIEFFPDGVLTITNRMGHIVYQQKGYQNEWDGFSNRGSLFGDDTLPSGTYYYTLTYNNGNNRQAGIIYIFR